MEHAIQHSDTIAMASSIKSDESLSPPTIATSISQGECLFQHERIAKVHTTGSVLETSKQFEKPSSIHYVCCRHAHQLNVLRMTLCMARIRIHMTQIKQWHKPHLFIFDPLFTSDPPQAFCSPWMPSSQLPRAKNLGRLNPAEEREDVRWSRIRRHRSG